MTGVDTETSVARLGTVFTSGKTTANSGGRHYLPDEFPDEVAELIERHATSRR